MNINPSIQSFGSGNGLRVEIGLVSNILIQIEFIKTDLKTITLNAIVLKLVNIF